MSEFRPSSFSSPVHGESAGLTGSSAGLHGAESQLSSALDVGRAHQFFAPGAEAHAMAAQLSVAAFPHGIEAAMMPVVPGAGDPISPIIQMIMRLPGQIGLFNSFFEALGNLFFGNIHLFGFDPSMLDLGAHASALAAHLPGADHLISAEHFTIDPSLLPEDAPILHMQAAATSVPGFESIPRGSLMHSELLPREALNVSGSVDPANPQFEVASGSNAGEMVSGPSMSDAPVGNHLASGDRVFSDRFQGSMFSKPQHGSLLAGSGLAQTVPINSTPQVPNSFNVSASSFTPEPQALPAVAQVSDTLGAGTAAPAGGALGGAESGNLLAANPDAGIRPSLDLNASAADGLPNRGQLLASNSVADAFRPRLSSDTSSVTSAQNATAAHSSSAPTSQNVTPLKAKELSLDSVTSGPTHTPLHTSQPAAHVNLAHHTAPLHHADAAAPAAAKHGQLLDKPGETANAASQPAHKISENVAHHDSTTQHLGQRHHLPGNGHKDLLARSTPKDVTAAKPIGNTDLAASGAKSATYTIRAGDCLWNVARNHLGSGFKWHDLYQLNHDVVGANPSMLHTGMHLRLPGAHPDIAQAGGEAGSYVVKPGDNLWNIAKDQLHDATKWGDLFKSNTSIIGANPRMIMPGQELAMPRGTLLASAPSAGPSPAVDQIAQADTASMTAPSMMAPGATPPMHAPAAPSEISTSMAPAPMHVQHSLMQRLVPNANAQLTPQAGTGTGTPAPSVHLGPGAASAATLPTYNSSFGAMRPSLHPVVDGAVRSNLASFLSQGK